MGVIGWLIYELSENQKNCGEEKKCYPMGPMVTIVVIPTVYTLVYWLSIMGLRRAIQRWKDDYTVEF